MTPKEFYATDIGKLLSKLENCLGRAWCTDHRETASNASIKRDWDAAAVARIALIDRIAAFTTPVGDSDVNRAHSMALAPNDYNPQRAVIVADTITRLHTALLASQAETARVRGEALEDAAKRRKDHDDAG